MHCVLKPTHGIGKYKLVISDSKKVLILKDLMVNKIKKLELYEVSHTFKQHCEELIKKM